MRKVGHAGTLDPAATGVLVVLLGKATRLARFFVDLNKRYHGRIVLGVSTDTQDATGKVESTGDASGITPAMIDSVFAEFEGETEQVPPMVSALKREGTPLYVLARRGEVVERSPRKVSISGLRALSVELPEVEFEMECSKGTYVRTLAADIGERLGCGAHLGHLERTAVGSFALGEAVALDELTLEGLSDGSQGLSMFDALLFMPEIRISAREEDRISTGGSIVVEAARAAGEPGTFFRLSPDGVELAAVGTLMEERGEAASNAPATAGGDVRIQPVRVFTELD
jgi:tRNA pseudouridine55 synthase